MFSAVKSIGELSDVCLAPIAPTVIDLRKNLQVVFEGW